VIPYPAHVQLGVKYKPFRRLQLNVDASYTDWHQWDSLTFRFDDNVKLLEMARMFGFPDPSQLKISRGYRSVWNWAFGLQAEVTNRLTLRAGYEPRKSSIPDNKIDLMAPLPDTRMVSLGFHLKLDGTRDINVGASYMKGKYNIPANTDCNLNCNNFFNVIYNPYAGLDVSGGIRIRYFGMTLRRKL
jgi:long-subunit fatty acid transport protein